jgi:hypothetical protein
VNLAFVAWKKTDERFCMKEKVSLSLSQPRFLKVNGGIEDEADERAGITQV